MGAVVAKPNRRLALKRLRRRRMAKVVGGLAMLCVYGVLLSIVWAAAYAIVRPPMSTLAFMRALEGQQVRAEWRPLEDISPHLIYAVVASEDSLFCSHNGFDLDALKLAISDARNGKSLRGASTISQQTAKNAFLWNGGGYVRKAGEAWFTVWVEFFWSKRRILEIYLNLAEWGDGLFGAEAAAQARFGKSAADLTPREAALLAVVLPNPNTWRLDPPGDYVRQRAGVIQQRMRVVANDGLAGCVLDPRST